MSEPAGGGYSNASLDSLRLANLYCDCARRAHERQIALVSSLRKVLAAETERLETARAEVEVAEGWLRTVGGRVTVIDLEGSPNRGGGGSPEVIVNGKIDRDDGGESISGHSGGLGSVASARPRTSARSGEREPVALRTRWRRTRSNLWGRIGAGFESGRGVLDTVGATEPEISPSSSPAGSEDVGGPQTRRRSRTSLAQDPVPVAPPQLLPRDPRIGLRRAVQAQLTCPSSHTGDAPYWATQTRLTPPSSPAGDVDVCDSPTRKRGRTSPGRSPTATSSPSHSPTTPRLPAPGEEAHTSEEKISPLFDSHLVAYDAEHTDSCIVS
mmetsp:Transcript_6082/g.9176  ORF Transcript_6082/g.9176 Transcript_6082/m.9176 type:complete len:326 (+) Transcript_6082:107-1084(+)|eukprot:CAMPEP_0194301982 /NCGR_PEP_ID=MMETSP0169-20130528/62090_1 /TAXON_ID=218684 /ORGANISM="Corethron pennatum, Strain L29A3" /LENGTH=325 /DNA_ID=CAMNT_0039052275 /DNA_START=101 /DNA_END=1078 /DNA_ORIENTATION=+